jgi:hypothetical protein
VFHLVHSTPDWLSQTHPCFHSSGVGSVRRTSHPSGSRPFDVSLLSQPSAPGIVLPAGVNAFRNALAAKLEAEHAKLTPLSQELFGKLCTEFKKVEVEVAY